jgi:hypothetical protein
VIDGFCQSLGNSEKIIPGASENLEKGEEIPTVWTKTGSSHVFGFDFGALEVRQGRGWRWENRFRGADPRPRNKCGPNNAKSILIGSVFPQPIPASLRPGHRI